MEKYKDINNKKRYEKLINKKNGLLKLQIESKNLDDCEYLIYKKKKNYNQILKKSRSKKFINNDFIKNLIYALISTIAFKTKNKISNFLSNTRPYSFLFYWPFTFLELSKRIFTPKVMIFWTVTLYLWILLNIKEIAKNFQRILKYLIISNPIFAVITLVTFVYVKGKKLPRYKNDFFQFEGLRVSHQGWGEVPNKDNNKHYGNTLEGIIRARIEPISDSYRKSYGNLVSKYNGVEIDVHMTKDYKMVIMHDDTINRSCITSEGNEISEKDYYIKDITYEEMNTKYKVRNNEKIPELNEVYDLIRAIKLDGGFFPITKYDNQGNSYIDWFGSYLVKVKIDETKIIETYFTDYFNNSTVNLSDKINVYYANEKERKELIKNLFTYIEIPPRYGEYPTEKGWPVIPLKLLNGDKSLKLNDLTYQSLIDYFQKNLKKKTVPGVGDKIEGYKLYQYVKDYEIITDIYRNPYFELTKNNLNNLDSRFNGDHNFYVSFLNQGPDLFNNKLNNYYKEKVLSGNESVTYDSIGYNEFTKSEFKTWWEDYDKLDKIYLISDEKSKKVFTYIYDYEIDDKIDKNSYEGITISSIFPASIYNYDVDNAKYGDNSVRRDWFIPLVEIKPGNIDTPKFVENYLEILDNNLKTFSDDPEHKDSNGNYDKLSYDHLLHGSFSYSILYALREKENRIMCGIFVPYRVASSALNRLYSATDLTREILGAKMLFQSRNNLNFDKVQTGYYNTKEKFGILYWTFISEIDKENNLKEAGGNYYDDKLFGKFLYDQYIGYVEHEGKVDEPTMLSIDPTFKASASKAVFRDYKEILRTTITMIPFAILHFQEFFNEL